MTRPALPRPGLRNALVRRGSRSVLVTYPGLRLGNYLYFALHARKQMLKGRDYRVLDTGLGAPWYSYFPGLRDLMVEHIRVFDRREYLPPLFYQQYGEDFNDNDLLEFVTSVLKFPLLPSLDSATVTLNVRRGDYYESAARHDEFGFDITRYLDAALNLACAESGIESVRIVSDDSDWATRAVARARPGLRISEVVAGSAIDQFVALARSPRLVLANSTFSYWGAYVSSVLHAPRRISVYAPDLHARTAMGGKAWQHAPWWHVVGTSA